MITPDTHLLSLLLAIAKHGSFNRAATAVGISQPALSVKISYLERQTGAKLLKRGPQGAVLTSDGELLVRFAETIENIRNRASEELQLHQRGISGGLNIGATPIALVNLVPAAISQLDQEVSNLTVRLIEGPDAELNRRLLQHELDVIVGVVGVESRVNDILETPLLEDPLDLVMRPGTTLDRRRSISLDELKDRRWALPQVGSAFQHQVQALFIVAGLPVPINTVYCDSLLAIKRMAALGDRLAILPRQAVLQDCSDGLLTAIPIAGPGTIRHIGYRSRTNETSAPLLKRFIELLTTNASTLKRDLIAGDRRGKRIQK